MTRSDTDVVTTPLFSLSVDGRRSIIITCDQFTLGWLAGLLEGEGSFISGPPSKPHSPRISIQMTDRDVMENVGALFGRGLFAKQPQNPRNKMIYSCYQQGSRAVALMKFLRPLMGTRRQAQIDKALASYKPHKNYGNVYPTQEQILAHGLCPARVIAKHYGVSISYVSKVRATGHTPGCVSTRA